MVLHGLIKNIIYRYILIRRKINAENNFRGRIHHTFNIYKMYGVVYGGIENKNILNDLLMFDFLERKWSIIENDNKKNGKGVFSHSANTYNDCIIFFGGCDGQNLYKELRRFDFNNRKSKFLL